MSRGLVVAVLGATVFGMGVPSEPGASPPTAAALRPVPAQNPADVFQYPLPTWSPHCLGFGSEWRYCNGTVLRACPSGAVWLHTGADIATGIQPVMAAGDGVIVGYLVDPTFRGGVLIRHQTTAGTVITQYWHVWLRPGFAVGTAVERGEAVSHRAGTRPRPQLHLPVVHRDFGAPAWARAPPPTQGPAFPAVPQP